MDSDEEDLAESIGSFTLRDTVRDCLEKDPADRTEEDIEVGLRIGFCIVEDPDPSDPD